MNYKQHRMLRNAYWAGAILASSTLLATGIASAQSTPPKMIVNTTIVQPEAAVAGRHQVSDARSDNRDAIRIESAFTDPSFPAMPTVDASKLTTAELMDRMTEAQVKSGPEVRSRIHAQSISATLIQQSKSDDRTPVIRRAAPISSPSIPSRGADGNTAKSASADRVASSTLRSANPNPQSVYGPSTAEEASLHAFSQLPTRSGITPAIVTNSLVTLPPSGIYTEEEALVDSQPATRVAENPTRLPPTQERLTRLPLAQETSLNPPSQANISQANTYPTTPSARYFAGAQGREGMPLATMNQQRPFLPASTSGAALWGIPNGNPPITNSRYTGSNPTAFSNAQTFRSPLGAESAYEHLNSNTRSTNAPTARPPIGSRPELPMVRTPSNSRRPVAAAQVPRLMANQHFARMDPRVAQLPVTENTAVAPVAPIDPVPTFAVPTQVREHFPSSSEVPIPFARERTQKVSVQAGSAPYSPTPAPLEIEAATPAINAQPIHVPVHDPSAPVFQQSPLFVRGEELRNTRAGWPCESCGMQICACQEINWFVSIDAQFLNRSRADSFDDRLLVERVNTNTGIRSEDIKMGFRGTPRVTLQRTNSAGSDLELIFYNVSEWKGQADTTGNLLIREVDAIGTGDARVSYESRLMNLEANLSRDWDNWTKMFLGFRWFQLDEFSSIRASTTLAPNFLQTADVQNDLFGVQFGIKKTLWDRGGNFTVDGTMKIGGFANSTSRDATGFGVSSLDETTASFMSELDFQGVWEIAPCLSLTAAYQFLWLTNVAEAADQFYSDSEIFDGGDAYFHGFRLGFEYSW